MKKEKVRLDVLLAERGLCPSREKAQARILAGDVYIDGQPARSAGAKVDSSAAITLKGVDKYVSRGGEKLEGALEFFALDVAGSRALDIGASTGGFTDCLLQRGAAHVTAVDVGYGQLALSLRNDPRVTVIERVNARGITAGMFPEKFSIVTIDVSFISLDKILPAVAQLITPDCAIAALVKPQFEAGPEKVGRGGVVKDPAVHEEVLTAVAAAARNCGLSPVNVTFSPIKGPAGNIEFFMLLRPRAADAAGSSEVTGEMISGMVAAAHEKLA